MFKIKKTAPFGAGIERAQLVFEHSTFDTAIVASSLHIASYGELRNLYTRSILMLNFLIDFYQKKIQKQIQKRESSLAIGKEE
jgi:hypothetical protein